MLCVWFLVLGEQSRHGESAGIQPYMSLRRHIRLYTSPCLDRAAHLALGSWAGMSVQGSDPRAGTPGGQTCPASGTPLAREGTPQAPGGLTREGASRTGSSGAPATTDPHRGPGGPFPRVAERSESSEHGRSLAAPLRGAARTALRSMLR